MFIFNKDRSLLAMKFKIEIKRMLVKRNSKSVFFDLSKLCKRMVYLLGLFIIYFMIFEIKARKICRFKK